MSGSVNIQNLFGVFTKNDNQYAVMQQLKGVNVPFVVLSEAFKENDKASVARASRLQRLSLCYQISQTVAYLHSLQVNLVVKVISDSSIYVRKVDEEFIPVMTNLEYSRLVCPGNIQLICRFYFIRITLLTIKNMTHLNMVLKNRGLTVTARICGGGISRRRGVNRSLGLLIWQILNSKPLPSEFTPSELIEQLSGESERLKKVVADCLNFKPSKRPRASDVHQRLLDEYNDSCAATQNPNLLAIVSRCRQMIHDRRLNHAGEPTQTFSESDINVLLDYQDSWDDTGSALRFAPEVAFLIGAGILWDLIDIKQVQVPSTVVTRDTGSQLSNYSSLLSS
jgi:serine/threonine protein kinase